MQCEQCLEYVHIHVHVYLYTHSCTCTCTCMHMYKYSDSYLWDEDAIVIGVQRITFGRLGPSFDANAQLCWSRLCDYHNLSTDKMARNYDMKHCQCVHADHLCYKTSTHTHTQPVTLYIYTCKLCMLSNQTFRGPYLEAEVVEEIMGWLGWVGPQ